jgi:hypothetical protein
MRVVIMQPHFLPFIGYFDLMNRADVFVYYDTAQFVRRSWHCRTYISEQGEAHWLSAPVRTAEGSRRPLREMKWADDQPWRIKMERRLRRGYADSQETALLHEVLNIVRIGPGDLVSWNIQANDLLASGLNIKTRTFKASELVSVSGDKQQKIIRLCQELGATHYLCGPGSKSYVREAAFAELGIRVEWLNYDYEYKVPTLGGLTAFPSVLDLILRKSLNAVRQLLNNRAGDCSSQTRRNVHEEN